MKKVLLVLIIILIAGIGSVVYFYFRQSAPETATEPKNGNQIIQTEPTDFAAKGVVVFNNPGLKPDTPYLVYEEPGAPGLSAELVFDEYSICSGGGGALPCMAMSIGWEEFFAGKNAILEGVRQPDSVVLVRRLRSLSQNELVLKPQTGAVFTPWVQVSNEIKNCNIAEIMQTHSLDVYVTLKDGTKLHTVEPSIDEVFRVFDGVRANCPNVRLGTE